MFKNLKSVLVILVLASVISSCKSSSGEEALAAKSPPSTVSPKSKIKVTFLGTTTLLFDDGETQWMTDGFFSRPNLFKVGITKIKPEQKLIDRILARVGVTKLAAVIPIHSHFDHAFDAPIVAQKTGALLVGSASTANIGRGYGLAEDRIKIVKDGDELNFGKWKITIIDSEHSPEPQFPGEITKPLSPPAHASEYKVGESFSLLVQHEGRTLLVHGSAGFVPGKLKGRKAEIVYLGVGRLGKMGAKFCDDYWQETMETVGAKRAVVVHWDDYYEPLEEPLVPASRLLDDYEEGMQCLRNKAKAAQVELTLPQGFAVNYPFPNAP